MEHNKGLKQVSGKKSMLDSLPKKPTEEEFMQEVRAAEKKDSSLKTKAGELTAKFEKVLADKTLAENRNSFQDSAIKDLLRDMMQLAVDINNDTNEQDNMGSLAWIALLFKTCLRQKDKINQLDYELVQLKNTQSQNHISALIKREIENALKSNDAK